MMMDDNGDLLTNSHTILSRWKNYLSLLLDVRQLLIYTAQLSVHDPSAFEAEIAI
jgi:hypothetical protein